MTGRDSPPAFDADRILVVTAAGLVYLLLITHGSGNFFQPERNLFGAERYGMVFNSMALHLLQGRFDIDPAAIGDEGFVRQGAVYAYFGVFPALVRILLLPFVDIATTHVERLSCFLAMMVAALGLTAAVRRALAGLPARVAGGLAPPLLVVAVLSGPAVWLSFGATVYNEAVLWAWAWAGVLVAGSLGGLLGADGFTGRRLAGMACAASCCLLSRATTGFGAMLALSAVLAVPALRAVRADGGRLNGLAAMASDRRWWPALAILAVGVVAFALVNYGRWGNPLVVADQAAQLMNRLYPGDGHYPGRIERLREYGLFNPRRLWLGVVYYLVPVWAIVTKDGSLLLDDSVRTMVDAFETPPASLLLTEPLTLALVSIGVEALWRRRLPVDGRLVAVMLAALAVPGLLMLMAWYMSFRYRVEFLPPLILAAGLGVQALGRRLAGAPDRMLARVRAGVWGLAVLQIAIALLYRMVCLVSPGGEPDLVVSVGWANWYGLFFSQFQFLAP